MFSEDMWDCQTSKSEKYSYGNYLWYIEVWCFVGEREKVCGACAQEAREGWLGSLSG